MLYRDKLISKRMIDLKELANKYSVKINEKGSKAVAVDKIIQKIDETLRKEFTDKEVAAIKQALDNGVTLTRALEDARKAFYADEEVEPEETGVPAELAETEAPITDKTPEVSAEPEKSNEPEEPAKPAVTPKKKTNRKSERINEFSYNGKTQTIKDWAQELGMPYPTLYDRINRNGWSIEEAVEIPLGQRRKK